MSSTRLDALDYACLNYVLENHEVNPSGVDLGCGLGVPSTLCALAGARVLAIDVKDFSTRFARLSELFPSIELTFERHHLAELAAENLPEALDFVYSQRTLHYLRYGDALTVLAGVFRNLREGGRAFLSVSGLASELGGGYDGDHAVERRFAHLGEPMARLHRITTEVCLYLPDEFADLGKRAGLQPVRIWQSAFGNVKGVFRK
ncbi:MAG TPA: class I SAM-dependent methyltransferase [Candidatus Cybelea sp.]|nr:class I SAM-dependent methyltransferase [Candidatus Cybelea sp.]